MIKPVTDGTLSALSTLTEPNVVVQGNLGGTLGRKVNRARHVLIKATGKNNYCPLLPPMAYIRFCTWLGLPVNIPTGSSRYFIIWR